jgi:hypothetical protein
VPETHKSFFHKKKQSIYLFIMVDVMPKLTLSYFPFASRAEPIRLAAAIGKVPFTNKSVAFQDFPQVKQHLPLGQLPILEIESPGKEPIVISQAHAILRYFGKLGGMNTCRLFCLDGETRSLCHQHHLVFFFRMAFFCSLVHSRSSVMKVLLVPWIIMINGWVALLTMSIMESTYKHHPTRISSCSSHREMEFKECTLSAESSDVPCTPQWDRLDTVLWMHEQQEEEEEDDEMVLVTQASCFSIQTKKGRDYQEFDNKHQRDGNVQ